MENLIQVDNLTKDYGDSRGVFNATFQLHKGEVFGFLGPNGAGKTTTIRQMLGFIKPDNGSVVIKGKNVWDKYYETNADIGYLPGEINFPDHMTGFEFIEWNASMKGLKNLDKAKQLLDLFELRNYDSDLKSMSKGMKQKIGIVCAFMHNPEILILDEPTSGLDPLMQDKFVKLIHNEKQMGKTIFMSSHMFSEVEKTCDRVAIIKQGEIIKLTDMNDIHKNNKKKFKIKFNNVNERKKFCKEKFAFSEINHEKNSVMVTIKDIDINVLIQSLTSYHINYLTEIKVTLEDVFMHLYTNEKNGDNRHDKQ